MRMITKAAIETLVCRQATLVEYKQRSNARSPEPDLAQSLLARLDRFDSFIGMHEPSNSDSHGRNEVQRAHG